MSLQRAEQNGAADAAVGFWQTGQGTPTGYAVFGTASTPDFGADARVTKACYGVCPGGEEPLLPGGHGRFTVGLVERQPRSRRPKDGGERHARRDE